MRLESLCVIKTQRRGLCDLNLNQSRHEVRDSNQRDIIMEYSLTILQVTHGNATKQLSLNQEGYLVKDGNQTVSKGIAQTISVTNLNQLGQVITHLTSQQCLIHGIVKGSVPNESMSVVTESALKSFPYSPNTVSRTKEFFTYSKHAIAMLDIDSSDDPLKIIQRIGEVIPAFQNLQYLLVNSASSSIKSRETGEWIVSPDRGGKHLYFLVEDGENIPELKEILKVKLGAAGHSRIELSQLNKYNGIASCLERTLVDLAVFSPERIDFAAGAHLIDSRIYQERPLPKIIGGTHPHLNISQIPKPTATEQRRYQAKLETLKREKRALRLQQAETHLKQTKPHLKAKRIQLQARQALKDHDAHLLNPDWVLEYEGGSVTVSELMTNPHAYTRYRFADPLDGRSNKAKLFVNGSKLCLHSFARGGTNYYFPQGLSAIPCQSLPFTKTTWVKSQYFDEPITFKGIIALGIPTGGGKTQFLKRLAEQLRELSILYLTPSISLAQNGTVELEFHFYQNPVSLTQTQVSVCIDSAHKYGSKQVLFLDEIEQIMDVIASKRFSQAQYNDFIEKIKQADLIVLCDANLSAATLKFFHEIRQEPIDLYLPTAQRLLDRHQMKAYEYLKEKDLIDLVVYLTQRQESVFIPCSSIKKSQQLEALLRQYTTSIININAKTRDSPEVKAILEKPALIEQYQIKIYTWVIGAGMSFDIAQVNYVCAFVNERVGTPNDALQMAFRYRGRVDIHFHIKKAGHHLNTDTDKTLMDALTDRLLADQTFKQEFGQLLLEGRPYTPTDYDKYTAQRLSYNNELKNNYRELYIKGLTSRGFIHIEIDDQSSRTSLKKIQRALKEQAILDILAAPPLSEFQKDVLLAKHQPTALEQAQLQRYFLETFYQTQISRELITYDNNGQRREAIRWLEYVGRPLQSLRSQMESDREGPLLYQKKIELIRVVGQRLFQVAGIQIQSDGSLQVSSTQRYTLDTMQAFLDWLHTQEGQIACHFVKPLRLDVATSMQYLNGLLKMYGIDLTTHKDQEGRSYSVNLKALQQLNQYLVARQTTFLEKKQQDGNIGNNVNLVSSLSGGVAHNPTFDNDSGHFEILNTVLDLELQERVYLHYLKLEVTPAGWNVENVEQLVIQPLGLKLDELTRLELVSYMSRHYDLIEPVALE